MTYNRLNDLVGWAMFLFALVVYTLTMAPTASLWDCGEFIAVANELQVSHPPGAPFWMLIARLFAMFAPNPETVAWMVNLSSVVSSAFTVLFTFWIVTMLAKRILMPGQDPKDFGTRFLIVAAGVVGAATCLFSSSVWFNAVEAEVYAMSSFFTAIVVWLMLKWEARADEPDNLRWIVLITYLMGLSIGVHLLNLLTIPALGLLFYFRKYQFSWMGAAVAVGISVVFLGFINSFAIKNTFDIAWWFERTLTTSQEFTFNATTGQVIAQGTPSGMGLPEGWGAGLFFVLLFGGLGAGIWWSHKTRRTALNLTLLSVAMVYLGLSTYGIIYVRSNAKPPINENQPDNLLTFIEFMKREQYGDWPVLKGRMYSSIPRGRETDKKFYMKLSDQKGYIVNGKQFEIYYEGEERFFPRMHSSDHYSGRGPHSYINYVTDKGVDPNSPYDDRPSGGDNMKFFFDYQFNWMYVRYFMWNFVGREGETQDSDWESGLFSIGKYDEAPEPIRSDRSRNYYYFLPLLLGLLGAVFQGMARPKDGIFVGMLFFFTGLAIILYLNQTPSQPRERDYSYAGSFQTFAIWVGLGVVALWDLLRKYLKESTSLVVGVVSFVAVPVLMGWQNWDDHSRAGRYIAPDSAYNLLNSCAENGILFTNGDNDTFPLWYAQEVEGIRTDVRVVNLSLLNTGWYIDQLKMPINGSLPLPVTFPEFIYNDKRNTMLAYPRKTIALPVDKTAIAAQGWLSEAELARAEDKLVWTIESNTGNRVLLRDAIIVNLLENIAADGWKRPVYFANTIRPSDYNGLQNWFRQEGLAYRIVPIRSQPSQGGNEIGYVDLDRMYENMTNFRLRGLDNPNTFFGTTIETTLLPSLRRTYFELAEKYIQASRKAQVGVSDTSAALSPNPELAQQYQQRALEVVDFILTKSPDNVVPYAPHLMLPVVQIFSETGVLAERQAQVDAVYTRMMESIRWYQNRPDGQTFVQFYLNYGLPLFYEVYQKAGMTEQAQRAYQDFSNLGGNPGYLRTAPPVVEASAESNSDASQQ